MSAARHEIDAGGKGAPQRSQILLLRTGDVKHEDVSGKEMGSIENIREEGRR